MSTGPAVATATVRIIPDTTGFRAELQRQVDIATKGVTAHVQAQVAGTAAAANAAAVSGVTRGTGAAGSRVAAGTRIAAQESNALRGALIGLSRVTPVTVFGLGLAGTAAIAVGYAFKGAIKSTADFEHQLYVFQATTGATVAQMEQIRAKSLELGADLSLPSTSAGDAARAMTELAKAGLNIKDTIAGSTGVLQLAAAANLDVGSSATFVATELNAFGLSGEKATHVADLLAGASIAAQGEITDFGTAFAQVSAVANQADVSIETTTGALTELAKAGLKGADGGTSLRTAILRLTPTTKQAAEYQKALGIELKQNQTIGQQLPGLLDQYKEALKALTPVQQQQALTQIFGQDAYRAAAILIDGGSAALRRNTDAANKNGAANELAQANAKGLSGAFNGLKSNLDTLGITLGSFVSGPLEGFVRGTSDGVTAVGELATALGNLKLPAWLGGGGGGGGKGKKDKEPGYVTAVKRLFTPLGTSVADFADLIKVMKDGRPMNFGESPGDALKRFKREDAAQKGIEAAQKEGRFGVSGFRAPKSITDAVKNKSTFGLDYLGAPPTAKQLAIQKRFKEAQNAASKPKKLDLAPPNRLLIAQYNAQIAESLTAEKTADLAIESYFQKRLKLAVRGTDKYTQILAALQSSHSATQSVQDQINSEAKADAAETKRKQDEAKRIADQKKQDAAQAAADLLTLQDSILDLAIQRADYTENKKDDITRRQNKIKVIENRIAALEAIRKKTVEERQKIVNLRSERLRLLAEIKGLKEDSAGGGGFSLADLFKETTAAFNEYASNISSAPMTAGGATKSVFAARHVQFLAGKMTPADRAKLEKMTETNQLLADILATQTAAGAHDLPGQHTGENEYGAGYYKLPPGQRAMERARRMGQKVLPQP